MSSPAPIDPLEDTRVREQAAGRRASHYGSMAAMAAQFMGSFFLGVWAGRAADEGNTTLAMLTGVACAFGWAGVLAITNMARLAISGVFVAMAAPRLVKRFTSTPPASLRGPPDPQGERQEFWLHVFATGLHIGLLLLLHMLVAIGLAVYSPASFGELWWRFALAWVFLALLTWKALQADW